MLSKESMKGMDIVLVSTDVLYAFEQSTLDKQMISNQELHEKFQKGSEFLSLLANAVIGQTEKGKQMDLFMLRVIESLEKSMGQTPTMLLKRVEAAKKELDVYKVSSETTGLFEKISQAVMNMTSRSVEEISTSLR
jgi:galactitol-specific phosphotransferase system IIB component